MARTAITICLRGDSTELLTGVNVSEIQQRAALKAMTLVEPCEVQIWSRNSGLVKRKKFYGPKEGEKPKETKKKTA